MTQTTQDCKASHKEKNILWSHLPEIYRQQDEGTTQAILQAFEELIYVWQRRVNQTLQLHDPQHTPTWALKLLLRTWGFDPPNTLTTQQQRRLVRWVVLLHRRTGTAAGIEQAVHAITGVQAHCLPLQHGWTLDSSHALDQETKLATSYNDPQTIYAFDLQVHSQLSAQQHGVIRHMVDILRPVHCPLRFILQSPTSLQKEAKRLLTRCALCILRKQRTDGTWENHPGNKAVQLAYALRTAFDILSLPSLHDGYKKAYRNLFLKKRQAFTQDVNNEPTDKNLLDRASGLLLCSLKQPSRDLPQRARVDSVHMQNLCQMTGVPHTNNPETSNESHPQHTHHSAPKADLSKQASALFAWLQADYHEYAQALLSGLTRLPWQNGSIISPATQKTANLADIALLTQAVAFALHPMC